MPNGHPHFPPEVRIAIIPDPWGHVQCSWVGFPSGVAILRFFSRALKDPRDATEGIAVDHEAGQPLTSTADRFLSHVTTRLATIDADANISLLMLARSSDGIGRGFVCGAADVFTVSLLGARRVSPSQALSSTPGYLSAGELVVSGTPESMKRMPMSGMHTSAGPIGPGAEFAIPPQPIYFGITRECEQLDYLDLPDGSATNASAVLAHLVQRLDANKEAGCVGTWFR